MSSENSRVPPLTVRHPPSSSPIREKPLHHMADKFMPNVAARGGIANHSTKSRKRNENSRGCLLLLNPSDFILMM